MQELLTDQRATAGTIASGTMADTTTTIEAARCDHVDEPSAMAEGLGPVSPAMDEVMTYTEVDNVFNHQTSGSVMTQTDLLTSSPGHGKI